jgi:flagellum-specific ATP synthase
MGHDGRWCRGKIHSAAGNDMNLLSRLAHASTTSELTRRVGQVKRISGLAIDSIGPDAALGEMCEIVPRHGGPVLRAEVVAVRNGEVTLMPFGEMHGLAAGSEVVSLGQIARVGSGPELLGRVIDAFGHALDGRPDPETRHKVPIRAAALNPMQRPRITEVLETGVRCIDTLLTLGRGQRMGIFAGSGVGKSTLLGMVAREVKADVNVIALIGERGREVREFIDKHLGEQGLARSVVVVATSEQPALARVRAAHAAVAIAESFRATGQQVLLTMDSITRLAMARREVGLSAGEPPTARGYTPSVFAELPQLCERCGTAPGGGSITALFTVLVEGDDMNEPVADCLRATLDGHIVLSRELAHAGHYPAIDVLASTSRLMADLVSDETRTLAMRTVAQLAVVARNRAMVDMGAYVAGSNPELDVALRAEQDLRVFLRQAQGGVSRERALLELGNIVGSRA